MAPGVLVWDATKGYGLEFELREGESVENFAAKYEILLRAFGEERGNLTYAAIEIEDDGSPRR